MKRWFNGLAALAIPTMLIAGVVGLSRPALADQRADVLAGQYNFTADKTQIIAVIGGQTVVFDLTKNTKDTHFYQVQGNEPFCTKSGEVSHITFDSSHWSSNPPQGAVQVLVQNDHGTCFSTNKDIAVTSSSSTTGGGGGGSGGTTTSTGPNDSPTATNGGKSSAAGCGGVKNVNNSFFFLPHWWEFIPSSQYHLDSLGQCMPDFSFPDSLFPVGLAVIDILLRLAGFAAVIAVMISGIMYMTGQGNPDRGSAARKALFNALIGLGIVFTASLAVAFLGNKLAGG